MAPYFVTISSREREMILHYLFLHGNETDYASYNLVKFLYQCYQTRVFESYIIGEFSRSSAVPHRLSDYSAELKQHTHAYSVHCPGRWHYSALCKFCAPSVMPSHVVHFVYHDGNL